MTDCLPTLSGQIPTVNYVTKTKGCQKASLFSTDTTHPEIDFSQRKLLKMYSIWRQIPPEGSSKRKKVAEELPSMPPPPKGFMFIPFPLKSWKIVLTINFNTHPTNMFAFGTSLWLFNQKYTLTSRSKRMPEERAYLKKPSVCLTLRPLA